MAHKLNLSLPYASVPFLSELAEKGIECDQLLAEAIRRASQRQWWTDAQLFLELISLGPQTLAARRIQRAFEEDGTLRHFLGTKGGRDGPPYYRHSISSPTTNALRELLGVRETLTTHYFLEHLFRAISDSRHDYYSRPTTSDLLAGIYEGDESSPDLGTPTIIKRLMPRSSRADDIEFILAVDSTGRIRFRPTGHIGDFVQRDDLGLWVPSRALIVHNRTFGSFTQDQIQELEDLINDPRAKEPAFQRFFERYPHFFRRWDHRAVHPHVYLTREQEGDGPLIPDFILTNADAQQAFVVDLKLPSEKVFRAQKNRERFSGAIVEARAQLLTYRDWFDERANREKLKEKVGMAIYRPQLSLVIGRASEFRDELDRQKLRSREPDIDVVTYDDILMYAKRRQLIIDGNL